MQNDNNKERFAAAVAAACAQQRAAGSGIGTLGERTLHAALKLYLEPRTQYHEVKVDGFVADIAAPEGIIEIQTRSFDKLRRKLACFLLRGPVTVVYPIASTKWLIWMNEETGEITPRRKSPHAGVAWDVFRELYKLKPMLGEENLHFRLVFAEMEEYRLLNGWSHDKKKGSTRMERIPLSLTGEAVFGHAEGFSALLPPLPPQPFTVKELQKTARLSPGTAQKAVAILSAVGLLEKCGKSGRAFLYAAKKDVCLPKKA